MAGSRMRRHRTTKGAVGLHRPQLWFYDGIDEFLQDGEHIPASISTDAMGLVDQAAHPTIEFGIGGRDHALFLILPEEQFPCDVFFLMANESFHDTLPLCGNPWLMDLHRSVMTWLLLRRERRSIPIPPIESDGMGPVGVAAGLACI
jgi:hypothetical protein